MLPYFHNFDDTLTDDNGNALSLDGGPTFVSANAGSPRVLYLPARQLPTWQIRQVPQQLIVEA